MQAAIIQFNRDLLWHSPYHCSGKPICHSQDGQ